VAALAGDRRDGLAGIPGVSWRGTDAVVHNPDRAFSAAGLAQRLPYQRLENPRRYLGKTYLGYRTTGYQAALGCRFRCTFCGVAALFRGKTALPAADRLDHDLRYLKHELGADSVQFYDHNFFDRETDMVPLLEILARHELPWWCYARSDALLNMSESSWRLVRKSRLRMAYIGAESPSDAVLHDVRKGTSADQTLAAVERCRANGVTPELSFMLAPPHDPEGETEKTFDFIRAIKKLHPGSEIMLYVHTPLPPTRSGAPARRTPRPAAPLRDLRGEPFAFPDSADGWAEPRWLDYWCHRNAPWVSPSLRRRIIDFSTVLACRYPTITDVRSPRWGKVALRALASWRYRFGRYGNPWELDVSKRFVKLWDPRVSGL
jgi:radical SAM superfamily enzyme YgiQ (UPF0313 family)